jgi:hypothetical protein
MTGLPAIVALAVLNGVLVTANLASIVYAIDTKKRAEIAEYNLLQAERKWMACHESGVYTVGNDVYVAKVKKSAMNVRMLPEVAGL